MPKQKELFECPNCGSRNLQLKGHSSKGRREFRCEQCDEVFVVKLADDARDQDPEDVTS